MYVTAVFLCITRYKLLFDDWAESIYQRHPLRSASWPQICSICNVHF